MFGVSDCVNGTNYGVPWMLTQSIKSISKEFLRECRTWVDHLGEKYQSYIILFMTKIRQL